MDLTDASIRRSQVRREHLSNTVDLALDRSDHGSASIVCRPDSNRHIYRSGHYI